MVSEGIVSRGQVPPLSQEGNRTLALGPGVQAAVHGLLQGSQGGHAMGGVQCPGALCQPPGARSCIGKSGPGGPPWRGLGVGAGVPAAETAQALHSGTEHSFQAHVAVCPWLPQDRARSDPFPILDTHPRRSDGQATAGGLVRGQVLAQHFLSSSPGAPRQLALDEGSCTALHVIGAH